MSTILTYIAISDGKIKRSSLEVLSQSKKLADAASHECAAVIVDGEASKYVEEVAKYGATKVYIVENPVFKNHRNAPLLKALSKVMETANPTVFAFASSESTKDILGALGANQNAAVLPDVSEFELSDNGVKAKRPVMAAKILANTQATGDKIIVSVRSGSYNLEESPVDAETVSVDFSISEDDIKATLKNIISASSGDTVDLNEADVVIAAGRGVKDDEGKALITELASVLNAGVGASRALTESGVYDPSLQIGQTGKVVSPQLYIAVGISGAIQHVAGITNSKIIVAINKDPDAPIFEVADYGLVGDLYDILPPFIDELKKIKA